MKKYIIPTLLWALLLGGRELWAERAPTPPTNTCPRGQLSLKGSLFDPSSTAQLCLSTADNTQKNDGCDAAQRAAYVPNPTKRDPPLFVCAPSVESKECNVTEDLLIDLPYPYEWGKVFIPREARCGGSFDLILLLHGVVQKGAKPSMMLGGGVTEKDRYLEEVSRALIDAKQARPVLLADPTDIGTSCQLYDEQDFDFLGYFQQLHQVLAKEKITVRSISAAGHSGSACCLKAGMYRITDYFPALKVWGSIDSCYGNDGYTRFAREKLPKATTMFTVTRTGKFTKNKAYPHEILSKSPEELRCDTKQFDTCHKHPSKPWYLFQTSATGHHQMPKPYLSELLQRFFPPTD
jgi:hypothetical protein